MFTFLSYSEFNVSACHSSAHIRLQLQWNENKKKLCCLFKTKQRLCVNCELNFPIWTETQLWMMFSIRQIIELNICFKRIYEFGFDKNDDIVDGDNVLFKALQSTYWKNQRCVVLTMLLIWHVLNIQYLFGRKEYTSFHIFSIPILL